MFAAVANLHVRCLVRVGASVIQYLAQLSAGKVALWCYFIWYLSTIFRYFDPAPTIWLNSLGISFVVGIALLLSVNGSSPRLKFADPWQTFRLFFMPFAVSSFSALIKGHGFLLVFPPSAAEVGLQLSFCAAFGLAVLAIKRFARHNGAA
jgi:hypothetical protein